MGALCFPLGGAPPPRGSVPSLLPFAPLFCPVRLEGRGAPRVRHRPLCCRRACEAAGRLPDALVSWAVLDVWFRRTNGQVAPLLRRGRRAHVKALAAQAAAAAAAHDVKSMHAIVRLLSSRIKQSPCSVRASDGSLAVTPEHAGEAWLAHVARKK